MANGTAALKQDSEQSLARILANSDGPRTIEEVVTMLDEKSYNWGADFNARELAKAKKARIRREISRLKDKEGFPKFPSIIVVGEDGVRKQVFKQETLFDVEDYKTIVSYHVKLSNHHRDMAKGYVKRCKARHEVQLSLWVLGEPMDDQIDEEWAGVDVAAPAQPR